MKKSDKTLNRARMLGLAALVAGAGCLLIPGTSSAAGLSGAYGCLGRAIVSDNTGTLTGISELMHLGFNGAGGVAGKIILNLQGEVCTISTTGTYTVNAGGVGSMALTWNSATGDADGDTTCSQLNAQVITQHTDLVVEAGGSAFDFQEQDDFLTAPSITTDSDVQNPFIGTCKKQ